MSCAHLQERERQSVQGRGVGGGCRNLLVCLWLGGPAANQAQWFACAGEGRRDHPSHHYNLVGHPPFTPLPCTRTYAPTHPGHKGRAETGWQGAGNRLVRGEGRVRGQMDRDGAGQGLRALRWDGWIRML